MATDHPHNKRYIPQVRQVKRRRKEREHDDGSRSTSSTQSQLSCVSTTRDDNGQRSRAEQYGDAEPLQLPLPAYAHDLILDRLPARQRCRMRCVCKAWNARPPPAGTKARDSVPQEELWFVMARPPKYHRRSWHSPIYPQKYGGSHQWRIRAYSSSSSSWDMKLEQRSEVRKPFFRPPLPNPHHSKLSSFLGSGRSCSRVAYRMHGFGLGWDPRLFLCSAGGLMSAIVCRPGAGEGHDYIAFNCLTGCVKVLPPPLNPRELGVEGPILGGSLSMTLDGQDPSIYYILLSGRFAECFEVFESRSAHWKAVFNPYYPFRSRQWLHDFVVTHSTSSELSVVDADFWWWVGRVDEHEGQNAYDTQSFLLGYHVRHDAWTTLLLPSFPSENDCGGGCRLVVRYASRLLLGERLLGADDTMLGFGVWELQTTSVEDATLVEVARTPEHLCPALKSIEWQWELSADGGLFWMTFWKSDRSRNFRPPLVFDMARNSWYSLPLTRISRKFGCIAVHRPSFSASV